MLDRAAFERFGNHYLTIGQSDIIMRIIGLYGHSNCGKSATLNYLKELLRAEGRSISSKPHPNTDEPETFEYKGLIVCVAPGGDNEEVIENNVCYFKSKNCDIAISATRCKGGSVTELQKYEKEMGVKIKWEPKSYEYNLSDTTKHQCNQETAHYLFSLL